MAINLLPVELAPKGSAVKIAVYLKNLVTILAVMLVLFGLVLIAIFTINYLQLRSLGISTKELKDKIATLETTEQKYFLVKDRIKYMGEILKTATGQEQNQKMSNVLAAMPPDISLTQAQVSGSNFTINLETSNSISLATFMSGIIASPEFKSISLTNFEFEPVSGYSFSLDFH